MSSPHTRVSRAAAHSVSLLVLLQLVRFATGSRDMYVDMLLVALLLVAAAAAWTLQRDNRLEPRLASGAVSVLIGCGTLLTATLGLPGRDAQSPDLAGTSALVLSVAVVVLLVADLPIRTARRRARSPYAS